MLRRTAGMLLAVCVALGSATLRPVAADPAVRGQQASVRGVLAGTTTIHWSGTKGLILDAPGRDFLMSPRKRMRLYVHEGDYAYVAIVPREQPPAKKCHWGLPKCEKIQLLYIRDFHSGTNNEGQEFLDLFAEPPLVHPAGKPLEIYLMTDGKATLVLKPKGLRGKTSYTAGGSITGAMEELPTFCPTPACDQDGYAGRYRFGGKAYNAGRLGYVGIAVHSSIPLDHEDPVTEAGLYNQSAQVRTCRYPNPANWNASPDPEDHPWGCDLVADPRNLDDTRVVVFQTLNQVTSANPLFRGVLDFDGFSGLKGRHYVGYHVGGFGASQPSLGAYGIWFRYGVN